MIPISCVSLFKEILETQEDFEVVALAADGEQALEQAIQLAPDVAIFDIRMPKLDSLVKSLCRPN